MTITESMRNVAEYIRDEVSQYSTTQSDKQRKILVYAGFPPVRRSRDETASCIYVIATGAEDAAAESSVTLAIGFSIYDEDDKEGCFSLYNLVEHVRQALLKRRTIAGRNCLILPLKTEIMTEQPFPEWVAIITATYSIAQIDEEEIDYDEAFEN